MSNYFLAALVILVANTLPAFAPPTWSILVFFSLRNGLDPIALVLIGVTCAVSGRAILAYTFRGVRGWLPKGYVTNMENIGVYIDGHSHRVIGLLALFFLSPISSAQLFEAAGIIKSIDLRPLLAAFAGGRLISYSIYVSGAAALSETSLGEIAKKELTSPQAIAIQVLLIIGLIALGNIKWKPRTPK
ncbi:MAG: hypothetical protein H7227_01800 [Actinobacteria bacterium]|nr:hypothetical protein [Actinomycetota bacterium]